MPEEFLFATDSPAPFSNTVTGSIAPPPTPVPFHGSPKSHPLPLRTNVPPLKLRYACIPDQPTVAAVQSVSSPQFIAVIIDFLKSPPP